MKCIFVSRASAMLSYWAMSYAVLAQGPSTPDTVACPQIINQLLKRDENLRALSLEYREIESTIPVSGAPGEYLRRVVAARAPDLFMRDNGHGDDNIHWKDDSIRKTLIIRPNGWQMLSHVNRLVDEGPPSVGPRAPDNPAGELIFRALCWWPYARWSPPDIHGRSVSMSSIFKEDRYALRNELEVIDGHSCHVLEIPDVDVFWLDAVSPSCVLRRDVYNKETGSVATRFEFDDYRQYQPDVWLPGRIRNVQFDSYAHTPTLRQRRVVDATFVVSNIRINEDVDDQMFRLELPPGTVRDVIIGGEHHLESMCDGQYDHLASIIEWGRRLHFKDEMFAIGHSDGYKLGINVLLGFSVCWLFLSATSGRGGRRKLASPVCPPLSDS